METMQTKRPKTQMEIIENLQRQIDELKGEQQVVYPAGQGEYVLLPADADGKRLIKIVPNGTLAIANLFTNSDGTMRTDIVAYKGPIPKEGYIIDDRRYQTYQEPGPTGPAKEPVAEVPGDTTKPPADFATNPLPELSAQGRVSAIAAAILGLKTADFTTTSGYPSVAALSAVVNFDVTGKERDQAWEAFRKSQPNWKPVDAVEA